MRRFVALTWRPGPASEVAAGLRAAAAARPGWRVLVERPGMVVLGTDEQAGATRVVRLAGDDGPAAHGVVLGTLFDRGAVDRFEPGDAPPAESVLGPSDGRRIAATRGDHLIDRHWGRYVAFLFDPTSGDRTVLRDPSGALPCHYTEHRGVAVHVAEVDDLVGLGLPAPAVDWFHVGRYLHFELDQTRRTGLEGIHLLLPGERRVTTRDRASLSQAWNPAAIAGAAIDDLEQATRLLDRAARACIAAWGARFPRVVHRLSGGLDSAIVLGCLAAVDPARVTAVHYTTEQIDGDERRHARRAAAHAGVTLLERPVLRPLIDDAALDAMPPTARPTSYHYGLSSAPFEAGLARELGAAGFFTGHGGDEVLGVAHHPLAVLDWLRAHRPGPALARWAMDAALLSHTSLWSVLGLAARHGLLRRPLDARARLAVPMSDALSPSLRAAMRIEDIEHPSLAGADLPPAKLMHVFFTQSPHIDATLAPAPLWLDHLHPFHSQPLIEACLRVPVYLLNVDGRNRGLARAAFAGLVAPEILSRDSKGSGELQHAETARAHLAYARRHLLDGRLVGQGLLDRAALERMVDGESPDLTSILPQLLHYVYTEHWARRWG